MLGCGARSPVHTASISPKPCILSSTSPTVIEHRSAETSKPSRSDFSICSREAGDSKRFQTAIAVSLSDTYCTVLYVDHHQTVLDFGAHPVIAPLPPHGRCHSVLTGRIAPATRSLSDSAAALSSIRRHLYTGTDRVRMAACRRTSACRFRRAEHAGTMPVAQQLFDSSDRGEPLKCGGAALVTFQNHDRT